MQTPIDFGKRFLNNYFALRDMDKCLEDLAYDLVWITPERMCHFLSAKEVRDFLQEEMEASPERRFVDVLSIKSSPGADHVFTVAYEVNLVPKDHEQTVNLRCSMAICKRGQHYEITFLHMSEKPVGGTIGQIREFTQYLPCGVMIFAYMKEEGLRLIFCNDYFREKLRYKEDTWKKLAERDPFFMITDQEKQELLAKLEEIQGSRKNFAMNVTFERRDGRKFYHRLLGAPAYQEGENTVYYCVFQETTGFHMVHSQLRQKAELSSGILRAFPGAICVLAGDDRQPVYVSRVLPEMFGCEAQTMLEELKKDPFYGLQMTEITKDKLRETHEKLPAADPFVGTFQLMGGEEESRWKDFYMVHARSKEDEDLLILIYLDKDEQKRETLRQIQQAETMSRVQQERSREELRKAREQVEEEVRKAREQAEEDVRVALDTAAEETDALRASHQSEIDALRKDFEKKLREQEAKAEALAEDGKARLATLEKERDARIASLEHDRDARVEALTKERDVRITALERDRDARINALTQERDARIEALSKERDARIEALSQENENLRAELLKVRSRMPVEVPAAPAVAAVPAAAAAAVPAEPARAAEVPKKVPAPARAATVEQEEIPVKSTEAAPAKTAQKEETAETPKKETGEVLFRPMELLEEVCDEAEELCREKSVKLVLGPSASLPDQVIGDADKVHEALSRILESVALHTPPGDVITVAGRADRAAANRVILYLNVRDERSGIAEALRTGLFEDRQSGQDPLRDGLYAARELMASLGGTVQVRGRHGEGTVFILTVKMLMG